MQNEVKKNLEKCLCSFCLHDFPRLTKSSTNMKKHFHGKFIQKSRVKINQNMRVIIREKLNATLSFANLKCFFCFFNMMETLMEYKNKKCNESQKQDAYIELEDQIETKKNNFPQIFYFILIFFNLKIEMMLNRTIYEL